MLPASLSADVYTPASALPFAHALEALVARVFAGRVREGSLVRLTGGASQQTWAFDVVGRTGTSALILRRIAENVAPAPNGVAPETEALLMQRAGECGVPEPRVRHILRPADALGRGFVCERVEGETLARRVLRDEAFAEVRPRLAGMCGQAVARIHAIDRASLPPLPERLAPRHIEDVRTAYLASGARSPVFEAALRWLDGHVPDDRGPLCLVHGDFRHGNLIIGPEGIRAVLDWELAHLGDPAEDLAWITVNSWRFGVIDKPVGGFGTVEELLQGYREAGGGEIGLDRILFWRMLGSLRWGVMCREWARPAQFGTRVSVERAMIGRRASEAEMDLLDLLDIVVPETRA